MSVLNSKFDILRGWPNSSAVAEDWNVPTIGGGHDPLYSGSWVKLDPDVTSAPTVKSQTKASKDSAAVSDYPVLWGLVIEGTDEYSSRFSGKVTVLLGGGYVVRLYNDGVNDQFDAANLVPGAPVKLVDGKVAFLGTAGSEAIADLAGGANLADTVAKVNATLAAVRPLGFCLAKTDDTCDIFVV